MQSGFASSLQCGDSFVPRDGWFANINLYKKESLILIHTVMSLN
jgi:hypothetical protein